MELPLIFQGSQFLLALLLGLLYGLVYDFLKGLRLSIRRLCHFLDFLFALLVLLGNLLFALYVGGGEFRIFMLLGCALGAFLYFLTLRKLFLPFTTFLWHILTLPFCKLWHFVGRYVKKLGNFIKNLFSRGKKSVIIRRQHRKKTSNKRWEEKSLAPVQIKTCYQADFTGSHHRRHRNHRKSAAQD